MYTKRTHYYVFKQLFNFVKPGFKRSDISTSLTNMTVSSFSDPVNGTIVITGKNDSNSAQTIDCALKNLSAVSILKYYYTDASHNYSRGSDATISNQTFNKLLPPYCVFTLVSK